MSNPINQILSRQYEQFNKTFVTASGKSSEERSKIAQMLLAQKEEMEFHIYGATVFPEKIQSPEQFSQMLAAKISCLFDKDIKGHTPSKPAPPSSKTQYTGIFNDGANCWVNALLQILFHTPEGMDILRTIGEYYASGKDLDTRRVQAFTQYCCQKDVPVFNERAVQLFCAIASTYQRLSALEFLCRSKADPALIEHLIKFLPKPEQEQLPKIQGTGDLHTALNLMLVDREKAEENRLKESRRCGKYLLDALVAYNQTVLTAEVDRTFPRPISGSVSQNVRLAFHHFFGIQGKGIKPVFSASKDAHEDAYDGFQSLRERYKDILEEGGTFPPKTYSLMETRTRYKPIGEPRPLKNKSYTKLEEGNILRKSSFDYQLVVNAGRKSGVSVEDLLESTCFHPSVADSNTADFLIDTLAGPREQSFLPIESHREFVDLAPSEFTLVIKRSVLNNFGRPEKLDTCVVIHQVITLPASAFPKDKRDRAYALESFFVHRGSSGFGHYIAYRNINGHWIEFNDNRTRVVSETEIKRILEGGVRADFTPYALNYRLIPEQHQKKMLALSKELSQISPLQPVPAQIPPSPHEVLMDLLSQLSTLLKKTPCSEEEIALALAAIEKISPTCIQQLTTFLGIQEGTKAVSKDFLSKNAKKLVSPTVCWIRTSGDCILEQYIQREREKMQVIACRKALGTTPTEKTKQEEQDLTKQYRIANLKAFLSLLKNEEVSMEQVKAIFREFDLPAIMKNQMYTQIGEVMGAPKVDALRLGQEHFLENPRLLILPLNKIHNRLTIANGVPGIPVTTILEEAIVSL